MKPKIDFTLNVELLVFCVDIFHFYSDFSTICNVHSFPYLTESSWSNFFDQLVFFPYYGIFHHFDYNNLNLSKTIQIILLF